MTYTPNVPQATQTIAFTQKLIQDNFTYVDTALKVNHTWNGNGISTEAAGSHQRLDMPNQLANIVALPTGINAVIYAIGGNIYSYNGAKRPISGITVTGSLAFTASPQTIATLPADCIGYVMFFENTIITQQVGPVFHFMTNASVGTVTNPVGSTGFAVQCTTTNLTASHAPNLTTSFKIIYWPI
jgi:hypothetical protein